MRIENNLFIIIVILGIVIVAISYSLSLNGSGSFANIKHTSTDFDSEKCACDNLPKNPEKGSCYVQDSFSITNWGSMKKDNCLKICDDALNLKCCYVDDDGNTEGRPPCDDDIFPNTQI